MDSVPMGRRCFHGKPAVNAAHASAIDAGIRPAIGQLDEAETHPPDPRDFDRVTWR
jgi:hypothetical protein